MIRWQYLTIAALLSVTACQGTGESNKKIFPVQQVNNENTKTDTIHNMELMVLPDTFEQKDSDKAGTYVLRNNLDKEIIVSSYFTIEKLIDDKWQFVPLVDIFVFQDITYAVPPKESKEFPLALSKILKDGANTKGRYRIVKEVWIYGKDEEKHQLTAEFLITNKK